MSNRCRFSRRNIRLFYLSCWHCSYQNTAIEIFRFLATLSTNLVHVCFRVLPGFVALIFSKADYVDHLVGVCVPLILIRVQVMEEM